MLAADKKLALQNVIPDAFCELCNQGLDAAGAPRYAKQRATAECLNCNIAICDTCKKAHLANTRLAKHKVKNYIDMLLNFNDGLETADEGSIRKTKPSAPVKKPPA